VAIEYCYDLRNPRPVTQARRRHVFQAAAGGCDFKSSGDVRLVQGRISDELRQHTPLRTIEAQRLCSVIECLACGAADLVHHEDRSIIVGDGIVECESALIFWHETFVSIGEK